MELAKEMDKGKGGRRYRAAAQVLTHRPVKTKDAIVEMFVKVEKHHGPVKEPRCIQFRKPEFTLELARYLQPIEREFVRYYTQDVPSGEPRRKFYTTKGMTTQEKAALINRLW